MGITVTVNPNLPQYEAVVVSDVNGEGKILTIPKEDLAVPSRVRWWNQPPPVGCQDKEFDKHWPYRNPDPNPVDWDLLVKNAQTRYQAYKEFGSPRQATIIVKVGKLVPPELLTMFDSFRWWLHQKLVFYGIILGPAVGRCE